MRFSPGITALVLIFIHSTAIAAGPPGGRATPVAVNAVEQKHIAPTVMVPGTIVSRQEAELPAEVAGRLVWVADVGTRIKWGEPVARLDDTLYRLRASENKASLAREQARLGYLEKELARIKELSLGEHTSKTQLEKLQMDRDVASTEVSLIKAKLQVDEETLSRYVVRAPFDGVVTDRVKREGEWINDGETVVAFSNPKSLEIVARVPERSITNLKAGDTVLVQKDNERFTGKIRTLVPVGDTQSHLFELRVDLKAEHWLAGQDVRVAVPTGAPRSVLAIHRDALVLRRTGISVFRVNGENKSERVEVTTGIASGDLIEINGGDLKAGDMIVVRGSERLRPGQDVQITNSGSDAK